VCSIFYIAGPLFVEGVAAIGQQLVASSCVGHLNSNAALSALILAQSLYNVTGYSLVSGLASALETLCGQVRKGRIGLRSVQQDAIHYHTGSRLILGVADSH
jgi:MATE family multidrug resistance protein